MREKLQRRFAPTPAGFIGTGGRFERNTHYTRRKRVLLGKFYVTRSNATPSGMVGVFGKSVFEWQAAARLRLWAVVQGATKITGQREGAAEASAGLGGSDRLDRAAPFDEAARALDRQTSILVYNRLEIGRESR